MRRATTDDLRTLRTRRFLERLQTGGSAGSPEPVRTRQKPLLSRKRKYPVYNSGPTVFPSARTICFWRPIDLYRVNLEFNHLQPFGSVAFPLFTSQKRGLKGPIFVDELLTSCPDGRRSVFAPDCFGLDFPHF
jgi:hypothetical protein